MKKRIILITGVLLLLTTVFSYAAEVDIPKRPSGYPDKTLTIICPFSPGGAIDNSLRALVPILKKYGVNAIVTNVTGGSGTTGPMQAITSRPDGYTLSTIGPAFVTAWAQGQINYSHNMVTYITRTTMDTNGWFVRSDAPWKDAQELIEYIIENPNKLSLGTAGTSIAQSNLISEALKDELKGQRAINQLGYEGASRAATELIGGHIELATGKMADFIQHVRSGVLRPIMSLAADRTEIFEGIQTFNELPYDDVLPVGDPAFNATFLVGPRGIRPEIVDYLYKVFSAALLSDEYQEYAAKAGSTVIPIPPKECPAAVDAFYEAKYLEAVAGGMIEAK